VATTPSEIGARAELEVAAALIRSGRRVYLPLLAADGRVDLIYEDPLRGLQRTQCNTSRVWRGAITFRVCSYTNQVHRDYRGEIDVFGVCSPELDEVFVVPVDEVATRLCHLRLEPPRNNEGLKIRWAADYRLHPVAPTESVQA
jgi:hypothetical protein